MYLVDTSNLFSVTVNVLIPFAVAVVSLGALLQTFRSYMRYSSKAMYEGRLNFRIAFCQFLFIWTFAFHFFYYDRTLPSSDDSALGYVFPSMGIHPKGIVAKFLGILRGAAIFAYIGYNVGFLHHFRTITSDSTKAVMETTRVTIPQVAVHKNFNFARRLKYGYDPLALGLGSLIIVWSFFMGQIGITGDGLASVYESLSQDITNILTVILFIPYFIVTYRRVKGKFLLVASKEIEDYEDPEEAWEIQSINRLFQRTKWNVGIFCVVLLPLFLMRTGQRFFSSRDADSYLFHIRTVVYILHAATGILQYISDQHLKDKEEMLYQRWEISGKKLKQHEIQLEGNLSIGLTQSTDLGDVPLLINNDYADHSSRFSTREIKKKPRKTFSGGSDTLPDAKAKELFETILLCSNFCLLKERENSEGAYDPKMKGNCRGAAEIVGEYHKFKVTLNDINQMLTQPNLARAASSPISNNNGNASQSNDSNNEMFYIVYAKKFIQKNREMLGLTTEKLQSSLAIDKNLARFNPVGPVPNFLLQSFVLHDERLILDQITIEKRRMILNDLIPYTNNLQENLRNLSFLQPLVGIYSLQLSSDLIVSYILYENPYYYAKQYDITVVLRADHITQLHFRGSDVYETNITRAEYFAIQKLVANLPYKDTALATLTRDVNFLAAHKQTGYALYLMFMKSMDKHMIILAYHPLNMTFGSNEQGLISNRPASLVDGMKDPAMYGSLTNDKLLDLFTL